MEANGVEREEFLDVEIDRLKTTVQYEQACCSFPNLDDLSLIGLCSTMSRQARLEVLHRGSRATCTLAISLQQASSPSHLQPLCIFSLIRRATN